MKHAMKHERSIRFKRATIEERPHDPERANAYERPNR